MGNVVIFSGYTPKNDVEKFDAEVEKVIRMIKENNFRSITIKHDGEDIEITLIKGDFHIDKVTGRYK